MILFGYSIHTTRIHARIEIHRDLNQEDDAEDLPFPPSKLPCQISILGTILGKRSFYHVGNE